MNRSIALAAGLACRTLAQPSQAQGDARTLVDSARIEDLLTRYYNNSARAAMPLAATSTSMMPS